MGLNIIMFKINLLLLICSVLIFGCEQKMTKQRARKICNEYLLEYMNANNLNEKATILEEKIKFQSSIEVQQLNYIDISFLLLSDSTVIYLLYLELDDKDKIAYFSNILEKNLLKYMKKSKLEKSKLNELKRQLIEEELRRSKVNGCDRWMFKSKIIKRLYIKE